jgi:DnaK suppressor protein
MHVSRSDVRRHPLFDCRLVSSHVEVGGFVFAPGRTGHIRKQASHVEVQSLQEKLQKERADLLGRALPPIETARGDEADLALMAENKERELWLANDLRQRLELIDKALRRIHNGTYGKCAHCGNPIPEERLEALPLTLYDVVCQSKLEKKNRH